MPLLYDFFARNVDSVAKELLGKKIVRKLNETTLTAMIVETEAYGGYDDSASHASKKRTPRNIVMFGPAGIAYVYLIYGMHYMFNIVSGYNGEASAVLIRAVEPLQGQAHMENLRGKNKHNLSNGPARLCQALAINKTFNCWNLLARDILWLEDYQSIPNTLIATGPRIGINYATLADQQALRRFWIKNNKHVSRE